MPLGMDHKISDVCMLCSDLERSQPIVDHARGDLGNGPFTVRQFESREAVFDVAQVPKRAAILFFCGSIFRN